MATAATATAATAAAKDEQTAHRFAKDQLKAFVERVERLEEEKKAIADDIRDVYAEAKGNGFDVKSLRVVVRLRQHDINARKEPEATLETYLHALGMILYAPSFRPGAARAAIQNRCRARTLSSANSSGIVITDSA